MSAGATPPLEVDSLWFKARPDGAGLLPCVVQDLRSRRVLMVAWVNKQALERALDSGFATFWSRSRRELWEKGATSGNRQKLVQVRLDCDGDTLLYVVEASGPACHEGYTSCFTWRRVGNGWRRDPEEDAGTPERPSEPVHPQLVDDLLDAAARAAEEPAPAPPARSVRPEKAIRVGAPIESRARAVANALQLKQREKARDTAVQLLSELLRGLKAAGVPPDELRRALEGGTERARSASGADSVDSSPRRD